MASHSPQSRRRPQTQQINPGAMLNRETSPSPSLRERPRAVKGQSMPLVPTTSLFGVPPGSQNQQQSSPTIPNTGVRRSPPPGQIARLLPTPPHPNPPNFTDDRRMSPPPISQQAHGHYARPSPRGPTASYPTKLHHLEEYQMTEELLADIERADKQYQSVQPNAPYPYSSGAPGESPSSGKGPNIDRVRGPPDGNLNNPDGGQQRVWQTQQQQQRESPIVRERPAASPNVAPFIPGQAPSHTPERRSSPQHTPIVIPGEPHPSSYLAQFANREAAAAAALRRGAPNENRLNMSMANQTPSSQNAPTRTPDRSLPVQEEDEVTAKNNGGAWQVDHQPVEQQFHSASPTPSSDLNLDGVNQRFDNVAAHSGQAGHRDDDQPVHKHENNHTQYAKRDSNDEDGSYTPRSPTAGLPEADSFYPTQSLAAINPALPAPRAKARNGTTDHIMLGLESALQEASPVDVAPQQQLQPADRSSQYPDQRQHIQNNNGNQYQNYPPREEFDRQQSANGSNDNRYRPPQVYPDDFQGYNDDSMSAYIQSYLPSPRPDAPIPPTPHSQTAAPSPSPYVSAYSIGKDSAYRAMRAAGSPYPFPYNHVRRNRQIPSHMYSNAGESALVQQFTRQWQIYAQNHAEGITDSTLSPSSTPFQGEMFEHWADLHNQRMMRPSNGNFDAASIQSSPSHQPISLPLPPAFSGVSNRHRYQPKRRSYDRKPPPRVESTQPRETSPELSSSGEETSTAGEERPRSAPVGRVATASLPPTIITNVDADDNGEWVDEDEDDDYEDLIELEYHPSFVRNISKRRRKWEVGWESLIQAFQALDRQTDATMVLLASPSHTTKLHALRSRSIRRQQPIANSIGMVQIRSGFSHVAAQRRATRPDKSSLVDRLKESSGSSGGDGSDGSSGSVEENLRRALDVALESLGAMGEVYEQREMRVMEELQRSREDRERVELLLRQVLGDKTPMSAQQPRSAS